VLAERFTPGGDAKLAARHAPAKHWLDIENRLSLIHI